MDEPSHDQRTNVFFALKPAPGDAHRLHDVGRNLERRGMIRGRRVAPACLHLSLVGVGGGRGRIPPDAVSAMKRAVAEVRFPAFEIVFDRVVTFRTGQVRAPIVAIDSNDAIEAMALRLAIRAALEAKGIRLPVRSSFAPHMTLCWGESDQPEFPIAPISWPVHEMCLVESWVGAGRHLALATWPLGRSTSRAHV